MFIPNVEMTANSTSLPTQKIPIVIVFGPSGAGKSSVLNMLPGVGNESKAPTSSSAVGVTLTATPHIKQVGEKRVKIYDTAGLNEDSRGSVPGIQAIESLHSLILSIPPDGISLLVFVLPAGRVTTLIQDNYKMFYTVLCHSKVKIVAIFTHLEHEVDMQSWWQTNKSIFDGYGLQFSDQACITASPLFPPIYEESTRRVEEMLNNQLRDVIPWVPTPEHWLTDILLMPPFRSPQLLNSSFIRNLSPDLKQAISSYASVAKENASRAKRTLSRAPLSDGNKIRVLAIRFGTHPNANYIKDSDKIKFLSYSVDQIEFASVEGSSNDVSEDEKPRKASLTSNTSMAAIPHNDYTDMSDNDIHRRQKHRMDDIVKIYEKLHEVTVGSKGINLVLMIIADSSLDNGTLKIVYDVLYKQFLQQYVPISLLITGSKAATEDQWMASRMFLDGNGMIFHDHAYLPALHPQEEAEAGNLIETLILKSYTPISFLVTDPALRLRDFLRSFVLWRKIGLKNKVLIRDLHDALLDPNYTRLISHTEAVDRANALGRKYYRQHLSQVVKGWVRRK